MNNPGCCNPGYQLIIRDGCKKQAKACRCVQAIKE